MAKIIFRVKGIDKIVECDNGKTLLEVAEEADIGLFGGCGGAGVCGSCHVYIEPQYMEKIKEASFEEQDLLEAVPNGKVNSRLACQVVISDELDGMVVELP